MSLDVTVSLIVVGLAKYHDSEEKYTATRIEYDILPDTFTLRYGFRHCFNYHTSEYSDLVFGEFIGEDDLTSLDDYLKLGLNLEEANEINNKLNKLNTTGVVSCGMITLENWFKIAEAEGVDAKGSYKALLDAYALYHEELEDRKVLVYVENDDWY